MYIVINKFKDLEDKNEHKYKVGDEFPYDNREIDNNRITDLTTSNNRIGVPLIKFEEDNQGDKVPGTDDENKPGDNTPGTGGEDKPGDSNPGLGGDDKLENNNSDLNGLKQPELKAIAKALEIQFKAVISNTDLIKLIEDKRAERKSNKE